MPIPLYAIFLKGPRWLRALVCLGFVGLFLFGCLYTATTSHNATERTVPAHVHARSHVARYLRS